MLFRFVVSFVVAVIVAVIVGVIFRSPLMKPRSTTYWNTSSVRQRVSKYDTKIPFWDQMMFDALGSLTEFQKNADMISGSLEGPLEPLPIAQAH